MPPTKKQIEKKVNILASSLNTVFLFFKEYQSEIEIQALTGELISKKKKIIKEQSRLDKERRRKLEDEALLADNKW